MNFELRKMGVLMRMDESIWQCNGLPMSERVNSRILVNVPWMYSATIITIQTVFPKILAVSGYIASEETSNKFKILGRQLSQWMWQPERLLFSNNSGAKHKILMGFLTKLKKSGIQVFNKTYITLAHSHQNQKEG